MNWWDILCPLLYGVVGGHARSMIVVNSCPATIWPGMHTGGDKPPTQATGWELAPGQSTKFDVPNTWTAGRIWGRTACTIGQDGVFNCLTGNCGDGAGSGGKDGSLLCTHSDVPPATLAEFTLAENGEDNYDISLVDGFNVPMIITPSKSECTAPACAVNLNPMCPPILRSGIDSSGNNYGCLSACGAGFGAEIYGNRDCCTGAYSVSGVCQSCGVDYVNLFKDNCATSYAYAYDEKSGTALWTCSASSAAMADYTITFCPNSTSFVGNAEPTGQYLSATAPATCTSKGTSWSSTFPVSASPTSTATKGTISAVATVAPGVGGMAAMASPPPISQTPAAGSSSTSSSAVPLPSGSSLSSPSSSAASAIGASSDTGLSTSPAGSDGTAAGVTIGTNPATGQASPSSSSGSLDTLSISTDLSSTTQAVQSISSDPTSVSSAAVSPAPPSVSASQAQTRSSAAMDSSSSATASASQGGAAPTSSGQDGDDEEEEEEEECDEEDDDENTSSASTASPTSSSASSTSSSSATGMLTGQGAPVTASSVSSVISSPTPSSTIRSGGSGMITAPPPAASSTDSPIAAGGTAPAAQVTMFVTTSVPVTVTTTVHDAQSGAVVAGGEAVDTVTVTATTSVWGATTGAPSSSAMESSVNSSTPSEPSGPSTLVDGGLTPGNASSGAGSGDEGASGGTNGAAQVGEGWGNWHLGGAGLVLSGDEAGPAGQWLAVAPAATSDGIQE